MRICVRPEFFRVIFGFRTMRLIIDCFRKWLWVRPKLCFKCPLQFTLWNYSFHGPTEPCSCIVFFVDLVKYEMCKSNFLIWFSQRLMFSESRLAFCEKQLTLTNFKLWFLDSLSHSPQISSRIRKSYTNFAAVNCEGTNFSESSSAFETVRRKLTSFWIS